MLQCQTDHVELVGENLSNVLSVLNAERWYKRFAKYVNLQLKENYIINA